MLFCMLFLYLHVQEEQEQKEQEEQEEQEQATDRAPLGSYSAMPRPVKPTGPGLSPVVGHLRGGHQVPALSQHIYIRWKKQGTP